MKEIVNIFFISLPARYFISVYFYLIGITMDFKITLTKNISKPVEKIKLDAIQSKNIFNLVNVYFLINMLIRNHIVTTYIFSMGKNVI